MVTHPSSNPARHVLTSLQLMALYRQQKTCSHLCLHWPCTMEPASSFDTFLFINWWAKCLFSLSQFLWVSRTGSASDWCALREALYKLIDTIQYNTHGCRRACLRDCSSSSS